MKGNSVCKKKTLSKKSWPVGICWGFFSQKSGDLKQMQLSWKEHAVVSLGLWFLHTGKFIQFSVGNFPGAGTGVKEKPGLDLQIFKT